MREAMSRWYGMWGNQLNITCVASQTELPVGTGSSDSSSRETEGKEGAEEKACSEVSVEVPLPCLPSQTASSGQHDGSDGPNWTKVVSP
jgi:hypothetical protein